MHLYIFLQFTEWCILNKLGLHGDLCTTDTNLKRTFQISRHHQCTGDFSQLSLVESCLPLVIQCGVHELLEILAGVCRDSLTIVRATLWDGGNYLSCNKPYTFIIDNKSVTDSFLYS